MSAVLPNTTPALPTSGLARALIQGNVLPASQIDDVQKKSQLEKKPFVDSLLQSGLINARDLAAFCSETFGYPLVDLGVFNEATLPEKIVDSKLMQTQRIVALAKRGNKISLAVSDPTNVSAQDQIKFQTGLGIEIVVVQHDALLKLLEKLSKTSEQSLSDISGDDYDIEFKEEDINTGAADAQAAEVDDAPIVKFLQKMLIDAINMGASDLHFEPFEKFYRIRFRVDGELREIAQPPIAIKDKLVSRIKVISKLDISEKRVPQDGRMKLVLSVSKAIDFRVSTLPTLFGEKIVMRILDGSQAQMGIDALGYDPDQKEILMNAIQRPYGMVLVTGPTGSGKTVSLYTCLNVINKPGINISTAEDPAEINLPGVNQVNINDRAGLTFPVALKSFLRQDPDVIMVGEIRDLETADIAIKAAQTGHMVFSTLHTNDAPSTLTRLMNMGVAPFNIASSVILITAQRLARRLCTCKKPADVLDEVLLQAGFKDEELDGTWKPYHPVGCERCSGSGYKGRVGIYQIMPITEAIERIILSNGTSLEIEKQSEKEGVRSLRKSGLQKVKQGLTSLEEVLGCTNE
ncbi:type IV-A pilus assembly ATPase PilB [Undibacterium sp. RTI2.1]|uniref:type IV-A pilus assembly ATPase PilB n=1 Tax=unclassified Undibacterium TaxID=2630295 RepID=UPI002AB3A0EA|nr:MULTISPECIES: type IV-A pilus assembly ATPase PilB [unclassified Undibacterium]MDY7540559.1 type IV-A pilus assembly ATPase PilB [Undibacterium sp. 5I1]MEB0029778.1 type IV-A pilus assembly ATPase PilB [Undibacterium sp. RTI2.1]MEB0118114.1 type IV-A pilus assembly ATPase PilB [Undibacterium sp. RTI2.2]MEB0231221.1 type IV-A pilus assembly ATPase PilB [Undibacterium sp. 10I3]MEB0256524.1 type IV-A pilus assembly ATPase PilB [Undibacterium sp. 5I1]